MPNHKDIKPITNYIIQPSNSYLGLRGDERKKQLSTGQLLVEVNGFAIIPLEHYKYLVDLSTKLLKKEDGSR